MNTLPGSYSSILQVSSQKQFFNLPIFKSRIFVEMTKNFYRRCVNIFFVPSAVGVRDVIKDDVFNGVEPTIT